MALLETIAPCDIRIDKEGVWYYREQEMFRRDIVNYFYQHLKRDTEGRYLIELEDERCYLEIEDAPFIVRSVLNTKDEPKGTQAALLVNLSDDSVEELDPRTIWIGEGNVLYCRVKGGSFKARFSRPGYYQLAERIAYEEASDRYELIMNDHRYIIRDESPPAKED